MGFLEFVNDAGLTGVLQIRPTLLSVGLTQS